MTMNEAVAAPVQRMRMLRQWNAYERLALYGLCGFAAEICFTAMFEVFVMGGNRKLIGVTSVYIFFVYAFSTMVLERIYLAVKDDFIPLLPVRAVIYVIVCYFFEFTSGYVLKKFDLCPWDYESFFHFHIMGLITFEYLPVWYIASILGELIVIRSALNAGWVISAEHDMNGNLKKE